MEQIRGSPRKPSLPHPSTFSRGRPETPEQVVGAGPSATLETEKQWAQLVSADPAAMLFARLNDFLDLPKNSVGQPLLSSPISGEAYETHQACNLPQQGRARTPSRLSPPCGRSSLVSRPWVPPSSHTYPLPPQNLGPGDEQGWAYTSHTNPFFFFQGLVQSDHETQACQSNARGVSL